jgi:putative flippase GtrA
MRFLKFGVVGVANTLITLAVFNLVAVVLGWPAVLGNALGWAAGFANSFVWNRRWTFADRTGIDTPRSLARFAVAGLCALLASSGIILALQQIAQGMRLDLSGALVLNGIELLAISVSLGVNYALATRWAFPEDPA